MPGQDRKLTQQIYRTISDMREWEGVLEIILEMTGASKAIFSLRDRKTAELVIPPDAKSCPLLVGFEEHYIESFISDYMALDPWTAIERKRHPFLPYALSDELPIEELKQSPFWKWLEPQGISDTICVGLTLHRHQWIAINIYWDHEQEHVKEAVLRVLNEFLGEMMQAWKLGEIFRAQASIIDCNNNLIENIDSPTFLLYQDGRIIKVNNKAFEYLGQKKPILNIKENKIAFLHEDRQKQFMKILTSGEKLVEEGFLNENFGFSLTKIGEQVDLIGNTLSIFTLSFVPKKSRELPIWKTEGLTRTGQELTKYIALGGSIAGYYRKIDDNAEKGKYHSERVRKVLGFSNINQIREHHIAFEAKHGSNPDWYDDYP